jgi:plastocyanin
MKRHAVKLAALSALMAGGAVAALPAIAPAAAEHQHSSKKGKTREVGVQSDFYDPAKLTIHVGDKVKWVWHPSAFDLHDVYVDAGPTTFNSPTQAGGTFSKTFKKAGTYKLYCTQHEEDMTMTLVVRKVPK